LTGRNDAEDRREFWVEVMVGYKQWYGEWGEQRRGKEMRLVGSIAV
jgi:hypothetical protein